MAGHPIKPIKKSKEGTFTAAAHKAGRSVKEEESAVLKKGSKASPELKKKAQFSKNERTWNHK
jgi:hypothetical protein